MVNQDSEYQPVSDIVERIFGFRPSAVIVTRWHKTGRGGKLLRVAKAGRRVLSKDAYVIEFFENGDYIDNKQDQQDKPISQPKTRSEKARQKASDEANAELDKMGV